MDPKQLITWLLPWAIRAMVLLASAKLGMNAAEAQDWATSTGNAVGAIVLAVVTAVLSYRNWKKALATKPPGDK